MKFRKLLVCCLCLSMSARLTAQKVAQPHDTDHSIEVVPNLPAGYTATLEVFDSCIAGATKLSAVAPITAAIPAGKKTQNIQVTNALSTGDTVCVVETYSPSTKAETVSGLVTVLPAAAPQFSQACISSYNDCYWGYYLVGGVEQSDLSSQDSETDGFIDLFARGPQTTAGYIWLEARFLGAPTNSNTQGIAAAVTNPSGTVTASTLSTVGEAIDYVAGVGRRLHVGNSGGQWTLDGIAGFGATTPLSSQSASIAFAVPAFGTNECNLLQQRFTVKQGYPNPLPGPGTITTTSSGTTNTTAYCVVQPSSTLAGSTTASGPNQITDIAFSPEDRTSFLLKYAAGLRYIYRIPTNAGSCGGADGGLTDDCSRIIADFTMGQDEAITGGQLRHWVYKMNAVFPIPGVKGVYFFGSAATRLERNQDFSPLLLTQVPIATGGAATSGSVSVPSSSVFVLPLRQSNRDFYRIGIALDLSTVLPSLFKP